MRGQNHLIYRQVVELSVHERQQASKFQQKLTGMIKQKLNPALDDLFSSISSTNETIRIDKLVLELGTVTEMDLEQAVVETALREALKKIRKELNVSRELLKSKPATEQQVERAANVQVVSNQEDVFEQFIHFLRTGHFPWWRHSLGTDAVNEIFTRLLALDPDTLRKSLLPEFRSATARKRLVYQLDEIKLRGLLRHLDEDNYLISNQLLNELLFFTDPGLFKQVAVDAYFDTIMQQLASRTKLDNQVNKEVFLKELIAGTVATSSVNEKASRLSGILQQVLVKSPGLHTTQANLVVAAVVENLGGLFTPDTMLSGDGPSATNPDTDMRELAKWLAQKRNAFSANDVKRIILALAGIREKTASIGQERQGAGTGAGLSVTKPDKEASRGNKFADTEEIPVNNAGLVLLHPFLPFFFRGLHLLDERHRFKTQGDAFKAVHLLQFIVSGQDVAPEHELALNKILCGMDVDEPVPARCEFSDEEKEECLHLMETVLVRWAALKTENPEALRNTYLQREGLLKRSGQGWDLLVERNTFDVMLEKLPWPISIIKLPWNLQILHVEW
ncbi:MAG: contractile injection system tape measure protein [Mangrovibacterium sp.]